MAQIRVILNAGATGQVTERTIDGVKHYVVPSYTLPDGVIMNRVLYPADEIAKSFHQLEGTFAPVGHPEVDGQIVNAGHPQAVNAFHIGAWNENVQRRGNRVYLEKIINTEVAAHSDAGRRVLAAIEAGKPLHTSTGLTANVEPATHPDYDGIARNMRFDHDCILLDEPGAATPAQGVGMLVNCRLLNSAGAVLDSLSYSNLWEKLNGAVRGTFGSGGKFAYLEDFDDVHLIYSVEGEPNSLRTTYTLTDDVVTLGGERMPVKRRTVWAAVGETLQGLVNRVTSGRHVVKPTLEVDEMDKNEVAQIVKDAMSPLTDALAKQTEALAVLTNAQAEQAKVLTELRNAGTVELRNKVRQFYGDAVADATTDAGALQALADKIPGEPGDVGNTSLSNNANKDAPDFSKPLA